MRRTFLAATAIWISLCAACSTYVEEPKYGTKERREQLDVVLQVCLPAEPDRQFVGISTISRYGPDGSMKSSLSGAEQQIFKTTAQQPVFERFVGRRPIDLDAVVVTANFAYMFSLQGKVLGTNWSNWEVAVSESPANSGLPQQLARGEPINTKPPGRTSPLVRYKVIRYIDYRHPRQRKQSGIIEVIPACAAAA